jgi:hypothetical protein
MKIYVIIHALSIKNPFCMKKPRSDNNRFYRALAYASRGMHIKSNFLFSHRKFFVKTFIKFLLAVPISALFSCSHGPYSSIPQTHVYCVAEHNDSIYCSTIDSGIFSFPIDAPEKIRRVALARGVPIRSIAFSGDGSMLAASYRWGLARLSADSLTPLAWAPQPAWSIKFDSTGDFWLAGIFGIYRQNGSALFTFGKIRGAHDIEFYNGLVAVAHMQGISLFNKETGALVRNFCKGMVCWTVRRYGTKLMGGGQNFCAIISNDSCRTIRFDPPGNLLWSTALDSKGTLYLGTQDGLFSADIAGDKARCIGFKGMCVKSLLIDSRGKLWVGRFSTNKKGHGL